jgi:hypothetical protein
MLALLADENFDGAIVDGLRRREPGLDIVRVQDVGLRTRPDREILAWAAAEDRIVLSHDFATMPAEVYGRVTGGELVPGVFLVPDQMAIGQAIDEILIAVGASFPDEYRDKIKYFPL